MERSKCLIYIFDSFNNETEGGIIKARKVLDSYKNTNKPFLEKHLEYVEDYSFNVKELTTELEYIIYNKELHGSKKD